MIDTFLRSPYQKVCIDPLLACIVKYNLSPHLITFFACITGLAITPCLYFHCTSFALVLLLLSGYFDTLDGSLARIKKQSSPLGACLDIMADRFVEFAIIFGLYLYAPGLRALYALLMLGSVLLCVTSFLVVGIFTENESHKSFHYSPGIMERTEAFILFGLMILLPSYFIYLSLLFSALVLMTAVIRIVEFSNNA